MKISREAQEAEYRRLMGEEAAERQAREAELAKRCPCSRKQGRWFSRRPGPHHAPTCPSYKLEPDPRSTGDALA